MGKNTRANRRKNGQCIVCGRKARPNRVTCGICAEKAKKRSRKKRTSEYVLPKLLEIYGDECACCGEDEPQFLTVDHIDGKGGEHRKRTGGSRKMQLDLIKNPREEGIQTLCFNCNCVKQRTGGTCPHQEEDTDE